MYDLRRQAIDFPPAMEDAAGAAEFMAQARNGAGEAWDEEDTAELERYRAAD